MDENKNDMTNESFLDKIKEMNLSDDLSKFMQSEIDKKVSNIQDKRIDGLVEKLSELTALFSSKTREDIIKETLKSSGLNEKFSTYVTGNTKEEIDASIKKIHQDFLEIKQEKINVSLENGALDLGKVSQSAGQSDLSAITDYVSEQNKKMDEKPTLGYSQENNNTQKE